MAVLWEKKKAKKKRKIRAGNNRSTVWDLMEKDKFDRVYIWYPVNVSIFEGECGMY